MTKADEIQTKIDGGGYVVRPDDIRALLDENKHLQKAVRDVQIAVQYPASNATAALHRVREIVGEISV